MWTLWVSRTGKTQTSVNCAVIALINDRQPLVTSNNAKALVPFKEKLPVALRELCIDISCFDEGSTADLRRALEAMRGTLAGIKDRIEEYEEEVKVRKLISAFRTLEHAIP